MKNRIDLARLGKFIVIANVAPLCATLGNLGMGTPASAGAVYTTFDPKGSVKTEAWCMNDSGDIAGNYFDSSGASHGFVRASDGSIATFDPNGSINTQVAYAQCINLKGWLTGSYLDDSQTSHGYVRKPDGAITTFDPAGSTDTYATGINSDRTIVGSYLDSNNVSHGFFRTADGTITPFDPPGSSYTMASQINRMDEIAGDYYDANGNPYVFVRHPDGTYVSSNFGSGVFDFYTTGINNDGTVAGQSTTDCWPYGYCGVSFIWTPNGTDTFFVVHQPRRGEYDTSANCIDRKGLVAGDFSSYPHPQRGYTRSANGTIRSFNPPGSTSTTVNGCNDDGEVTGFYFDSSGISHGFLRSKE